MNALVIVAAMAAGVSAEPTPKSPGKDPAPVAAPTPGKALVPYPSPLITEVLAAVPTGSAGDADGDGTRQVAGDEFIELVNPHDTSIDLGGWTLSDKTSSEKLASGKPKSSGLKWTFPACKLQPGQVVVVFNGYKSQLAGPVGDSGGAPSKGHEKFAGALVFSMKVTSERVGLSNTADWVLLSAPDGSPVQLIKWGDLGVKPPAAGLVEDAPGNSKGSVQRTGVRGSLSAHASVNGVSFSPGVFATGIKKDEKPEEKKPEKKVEPKPEEKPAEKPGESKPGEVKPRW